MNISIPKINHSGYYRAFNTISNSDQTNDQIHAEKQHELSLSTSNQAKRYTIFTKRNQVYQFEPLYSTEPYTRVIISLSPDHSRLYSIDENIQYVKFDMTNLIICSSQKLVEFKIDAFQEVVFYEIVLENDWMKELAKQQYPSKNVEESSVYLNEMVLWEKCNSSIWKKVENCLKEIESRFYKNTEYNDLLCEIITQNIFRKIIQEVSPVYPGSEVHIEKLMKVKQVLLNHLNMSLPNLSQIATQVTLSESTLKRHFKNVFGKSVYDYYLEKKMEYAKQILTDESLTVNEIAERLGYEKVSNFIEMFKKRYGVSPGNIKKKAARKHLEY